MLFKNIGFSAFSQVYISVFNTIVKIILARLLLPSDFGLIGMALVFINFSRVIQDFGIGAAIIHNKKLDDLFLNTAFITQIFLGLFLSTCLIFFRNTVADFYGVPILSSILVVLALGLFSRALFVIQRALLIKESNFKSLAKLSTMAISVAGIVALIMARYGYSYWSLVALNLIESICLLLGFWYFSKWRPKVAFNKEKFSELFNYSGPLLGTQTLVYFTNNVDKLLIGKEFGETNLGFYTRANNLVLSPVKSISKAISTPFFPLMSKSNSDAKIYQMYQNGIDLLLFIYVPLMLVIGFFSEIIITSLLGVKWLESAFYLQVFCFQGITLSFRSLNSNVFKAIGNTKTFFKLSILTKILSIIIIFFSMRFGLKGIVYAVAISNVLSDLTFAFGVKKSLGNQRSINHLNRLKIILGGLLMLSYLFVMYNIVGHNTRSFPHAFINGLSVFVIYLGTLFILKEDSASKIIKQIISKIKRKSA